MMDREQKKILAITFIALLFAMVAYANSGTSGIGTESDPIAMANISTNWNAWLSGGSGGTAGYPNNGTIDFNGSLATNGTFNGVFNGTYGTHDDLKINKSDIGEASGGTLSDSRLSNQVILNNTPHIKVGSFTRDISLVGTQAITGVGFKPSTILFIANIYEDSPASWGMDDGTNRHALLDYTEAVPDTYLTLTYSILLITSVSTNSVGYASSFDADGFTMTWTKTGLPTGTAKILYMAFR